MGGACWPSSGYSTRVVLEESLPFLALHLFPQLKDGRVGLDRLHIPLLAQTFCGSQCNPEPTCQEQKRHYWVPLRAFLRRRPSSHCTRRVSSGVKRSGGSHAELRAQRLQGLGALSYSGCTMGQRRGFPVAARQPGYSGGPCCHWFIWGSWRTPVLLVDVGVAGRSKCPWRTQCP